MERWLNALCVKVGSIFGWVINACSRGLDQCTYAHVRVRVAHRVVALGVVVGEVVRAAGEGKGAEVERVGASHVIHDACAWAEVRFKGDAGSVVVVVYVCVGRTAVRVSGGPSALLPLRTSWLGAPAARRGWRTS